MRKLLAGRIDALALVFFMSIGAVPFLAILLAARGSGELAPDYLLPGGLAVTLNFLGSLGFIYSVKLSPLSRTIPLLSLTPVFTALTAIPLLGELPDAAQAAGILLVVAGALGLNARGSLRGSVRGLLQERGAVLMMVVALLWAVSGPLDKRALSHASVYFHATVMAFGVGLGAFLVLSWQGRLSVLKEARKERRLLSIAVLCITLALTFQFLAIQGVLVSLVEAFKRAVGSLMAVVLGRLAFGETVRAREWISVLVMVAGVFLILA